MNSRERIDAVIHHRLPDRLPIDLGGTSVTAIHASAYARLRQALGLPYHPPQVIDPFQFLAEVDDDVRDALGVDTEVLRFPRNGFGMRNDDWKPWRLDDGTDLLVPGQFNVLTDPVTGDYLIHPGGDLSVPASGRMPRGGLYFDLIVRQPADWEEHLDPDAWVQGRFGVYSEADVLYLQREAERLWNASDRAIIWRFGGGGLGDAGAVPGQGTAHPQGIGDAVDWYVAHLTHPEYIRGIYERVTAIALKNLEQVWQAVGDKVSVCHVSGTDFGTQDRAFISPAMYRDLYKPFHKRINDWIHTHTPWKTFYHSCGSIVDLLDDMVDAGVDIINPVQCSAKGMDPAYLKRKYGDRLVFWGGGVDTQHVLPFGTPEEVYAQARERIRILGAGGGYVFNAIHNVQANVPAENLLAFFRAGRDS